MIERAATYIWKTGEFKLYPGASGAPAVKFVGGSPVGMRSASYTGNMPEQGPPFIVYGADEVLVDGCGTGNPPTAAPSKYIGVAYHSYDYCQSRNSLVTVIYPPAELLIFQGWGDYYRLANWAEEGEPFGMNVDDITAPFDTTDTYNSGDILGIALVDVGGVKYSVWKKATAAGTYYAKVLSAMNLSGRTFLRILLGTFVI